MRTGYGGSSWTLSFKPSRLKMLTANGSACQLGPARRTIASSVPLFSNTSDPANAHKIPDNLRIPFCLPQPSTFDAKNHTYRRNSTGRRSRCPRLPSVSTHQNLLLSRTCQLIDSSQPVCVSTSLISSSTATRPRSATSSRPSSKKPRARDQQERNTDVHRPQAPDRPQEL